MAIGDQARTNGDNNIAMGTGATTELVDTTLDMSTTGGVSTATAIEHGKTYALWSLATTFI